MRLNKAIMSYSLNNYDVRQYADTVQSVRASISVQKSTMGHTCVSNAKAGKLVEKLLCSFHIAFFC